MLNNETSPFNAEFTALVDQHSQELFVFLRSMVEHPEVARDLTQDTFIEAWEQTRRAKPPFTVAGSVTERRRWLFHVAYCRAISARRHHNVIRWESLDEMTEAERDRQWSGGEFANRIVEQAALRSALKELTPEDVACLMLIVVQGFTAPEAAQIMGASPQAIARRVSRAKNRLLMVYRMQNPQ